MTLDYTQLEWIGALAFLLGLALFAAGFNFGAWYQGWLLNNAIAKSRPDDRPFDDDEGAGR